MISTRCATPRPQRSVLSHVLNESSARLRDPRRDLDRANWRARVFASGVLPAKCQDITP
jgi:hypothetical protein